MSHGAVDNLIVLIQTRRSECHALVVVWFARIDIDMPSLSFSRYRLLHVYLAGLDTDFNDIHNLD